MNRSPRDDRTGRRGTGVTCSGTEPYPTQHDTLDRSGSRIHYWVCGPEDAPLVAFTHGASMDHRMFSSQVEPVVAAGYRVLTWDVRGHGYSKPIGRNFTVRAIAEDLSEIIDERGYEEATLVGQSFGGYVSQEFAFRYPNRVTALVVVGNTDITERPPRLEYVALRLSPYLFRLWPDGHLRKLIAKNTAQTTAVQKYAYNATCQLSKSEFVTVWKAVATCLHTAPDYRIPVPLLLTHGEGDKTGTIVRDSPSWADREPHARYEIVPDAGHNANQDNPSFFNSVLLEFLNEHVPA